MVMRLGIYQFAPVWGDRPANLSKIEAAIGSTPADLWILPELCTTGYLFINAAEAQDYAEEFPGGATHRRLCELSHAYSTGIVAGVIEQADGRIYNSAVVYQNGHWLCSYRKVHLFNTERDCFQRGTQPAPVLDLGGMRLGVMICFDWVFPEMARSLALRGAQIIAHPANLVLPYCQAAMVTRSLENRVFIATSNRIGSEERGRGRQISFTGASQIIAPSGDILCRLSTDQEATIVVEVDPTVADNKSFGPSNNLFEDRYPAAYIC